MLHVLEDIPPNLILTKAFTHYFDQTDSTEDYKKAEPNQTDSNQDYD